MTSRDHTQRMGVPALPPPSLPSKTTGPVLHWGYTDLTNTVGGDNSKHASKLLHYDEKKLVSPSIVRGFDDTEFTTSIIISPQSVSENKILLFVHLLESWPIGTAAIAKLIVSHSWPIPQRRGGVSHHQWGKTCPRNDEHIPDLTRCLPHWRWEGTCLCLDPQLCW